MMRSANSRFGLISVVLSFALVLSLAGCSGESFLAGAKKLVEASITKLEHAGSANDLHLGSDAAESAHADLKKLDSLPNLTRENKKLESELKALLAYQVMVGKVHLLASSTLATLPADSQAVAAQSIRPNVVPVQRFLDQLDAAAEDMVRSTTCSLAEGYLSSQEKSTANALTPSFDPAAIVEENGTDAARDFLVKQYLQSFSSQGLNEAFDSLTFVQGVLSKATGVVQAIEGIETSTSAPTTREWVFYIQYCVVAGSG
jgi:hypothetical protein